MTVEIKEFKSTIKTSKVQESDMSRSVEHFKVRITELEEELRNSESYRDDLKNDIEESNQKMI